MALTLILAYIAFFVSCFRPVFWTPVPEIFPNDMRVLAMTFPVLTQWIANAFVVLLFPLAFHVIGNAVTFGFLAVMALGQGYLVMCAGGTEQVAKGNGEPLGRRDGGGQERRRQRGTLEIQRPGYRLIPRVSFTGAPNSTVVEKS